MDNEQATLHLILQREHLGGPAGGQIEGVGKVDGVRVSNRVLHVQLVRGGNSESEKKIAHFKRQTQVIDLIIQYLIESSIETEYPAEQSVPSPTFINLKKILLKVMQFRIKIQVVFFNLNSSLMHLSDVHVAAPDGSVGVGTVSNSSA